MEAETKVMTEAGGKAHMDRDFDIDMDIDIGICSDRRQNRHYGRGR